MTELHSSWQEPTRQLHEPNVECVVGSKIGLEQVNSSFQRQANN